MSPEWSKSDENGVTGDGVTGDGSPVSSPGTQRHGDMARYASTVSAMCTASAQEHLEIEAELSAIILGD